MHDMHRRRMKAQCSEFLVGFVGSRATMTQPSASGGFVEAQPLIARLLKPPEAAITETTPSAHSLNPLRLVAAWRRASSTTGKDTRRRFWSNAPAGTLQSCPSPVKPPSHTRGAVSAPKDCALTLRSSRRVPAGRFRPSFHSRPHAPCLHARLNSNVSRHTNAFVAP